MTISQNAKHEEDRLKQRLEPGLVVQGLTDPADAARQRCHTGTVGSMSHVWASSEREAYQAEVVA